MTTLTKSTRFISFLVRFTLLSLLPLYIDGQASADGPQIRIQNLQGQAYLVKKNHQWAKLASGQTISQREVILTTGNGTLELAFASGNFVTIGPNGKLAVIANNKDGLFLSLYNGGVKIEKKSAQKIYLQTPNSFSALRQTTLLTYLAQFDTISKISTIFGYDGLVEVVAKKHHPFPKGVATQIYLDQLIGLDGLKLNKGQLVLVSMDSQTATLAPTSLNPAKAQELVAQLSIPANLTPVNPTPTEVKNTVPSNPALVVYQPPVTALETRPEKLAEYYAVDDVYAQINNDYWDEADFNPPTKSSPPPKRPGQILPFPHWHLSMEQKGGQSAVELQTDGHSQIVDLYHRSTPQFSAALSLLAAAEIVAHLQLSYYQQEYKGNMTSNPHKDLFHLQLALHTDGPYPWDVVLGLRERVFLSDPFPTTMPENIPEKLHLKKLILPYVGIAPLFRFGIEGQLQHTLAPRVSILCPPLAQNDLKISLGYQWGMDYRLSLPSNQNYLPHLLFAYFYERSYAPSKQFHQQEFSMGIEFQF